MGIDFGAWIAAHITGIIIGGETILALIAGIIFGILGVVAVWAFGAAMTWFFDEKQKKYNSEHCFVKSDTIIID